MTSRDQAARAKDMKTTQTLGVGSTTVTAHGQAIMTGGNNETFMATDLRTTGMNPTIPTTMALLRMTMEDIMKVDPGITVIISLNITCIRMVIIISRTTKIMRETNTEEAEGEDGGVTNIIMGGEETCRTPIRLQAQVLPPPTVRVHNVFYTF